MRGSDRLRREIQRVVREEVRRGLRDVLGGRAAGHAVESGPRPAPGSPAPWAGVDGGPPPAGHGKVPPAFAGSAASPADQLRLLLQLLGGEGGSEGSPKSPGGGVPPSVGPEGHAGQDAASGLGSPAARRSSAAGRPQAGGPGGDLGHARGEVSTRPRDGGTSPRRQASAVRRPRPLPAGTRAGSGTAAAPPPQAGAPAGRVARNGAAAQQLSSLLVQAHAQIARELETNLRRLRQVIAETQQLASKIEEILAQAGQQGGAQQQGGGQGSQGS